MTAGISLGMQDSGLESYLCVQHQEKEDAGLSVQIRLMCEGHLPAFAKVKPQTAVDHTNKHSLQADDPGR